MTTTHITTTIYILFAPSEIIAPNYSIIIITDDSRVNTKSRFFPPQIY